MNSIKNKFLTISILLILGTTAVFAETAGSFSAPGISNFTLSDVSADATLRSDKVAYAAGEMVAIDGEGFGSFEQISFSVESYSNSLRQPVTLMQWNVFADAKGRVSANLPFDSLRSANGVYTIKAIGAETGNFAKTIFTTESLIVPGTITIIKDAQPNSPSAFNFSATGQVNQNFSLTDNGVEGPDRIFFDNLIAFGTDNSVRVTELTTNGFALVAINCQSTPHSESFPAQNNNIINLPSRFVDIILEEGESVVCTFVNAVVTASSASVSGSTLTDSGMPLARSRVTIQNTSTGETQTVYTNNFGRYQFEGLTVGDFYVVTVSNRKYTFSPDTQAFTLNDAVEGLNFTATAR